MLQITCPWCGPRDEVEFGCGGEAGIVRPKDPDAASDAEWADYLYLRDNIKGAHREQWWHAAGCRRWFIVERHTVSYAVSATYPMGAAAPGRDA